MTSVREYTQLDLANEYLQIIAVFEIRALVGTRISRILNFFVPNFGSPCLTQSENFLWSELSAKLACWTLRHSSIMFSENSIRKEFSVTLQTHTNAVPLTFLWHRFCSTDHKTFSFHFSLSRNGFPTTFFAFSLRSKITGRNVRKFEFKHCGNTELSGVLVRVFREVTDILRSRSLMSIVSLSTEVILLNSLGS